MAPEPKLALHVEPGTSPGRDRTVRSPIPAWAVLMVTGTLSLCCAQVVPGESIVVNQVGYRPQDRKIALMLGPAGETFEVRDTEDNLAFRGPVARTGRRDAGTGDDTYVLDFTELRTPGLFRIRVHGLPDSSPEFRIAADVYDQVTLRALESFYYQRCGTGIDDGTDWGHPPCHLRKSFFYDNQSFARDVTGGWHDAGDYNRFVVSTALSVALLLYLYEFYPEKFVDGQTGIPERTNGIPDLLDEARWALEWLRKMQGEDGGIFHKVSIKQWTAEHLPHEETDPQYIFQVSSAATGAVAATTSLGSRLFREWDPPFALDLLKCATRAWEFLETHRTLVPPGGFRNPPDVRGGEYGDDKDGDERLWAAVELYRVTGKEKYHDYVLAHYSTPPFLALPPSWMNVGNLALYSYARVTPPDREARRKIMARLAAYARGLVDRVGANGYRCALRPEEFYWGSNSVALGYGVDLINAYDLLDDPSFLDAALDQLHYLLGRNPFNITMATGIGTRPVGSPYHQFSMLCGAADPVPGMVVGGPNRNSKLRGKTLSPFPGRCYEDNEKNYFVNETAINYTAPLLFVAGYASHLASAGRVTGRAEHD